MNAVPTATIASEIGMAVATSVRKTISSTMNAAMKPSSSWIPCWIGGDSASPLNSTWTPAGSTAYNLSAYGPILPINAPLLALTPISPFRPRRWRGALLPNVAKIRFDVLEPEKRPVSAVADHAETRAVAYVEVEQASGVDLYMMFDPGHSLDERILSEQFRY